MDHLYREVSTAFPERIISHIEVRQEGETCRILRIGFRGSHSKSLFRSFLHERNQMKALVETCLHDAEDLGLTLPYEQIYSLLLAACKDVEVKPSDQVLLLGGAGLGTRRVGMRPHRPGFEGCLMRGDHTLARFVARPRAASRASALDEPMDGVDRRKPVYAVLLGIPFEHQTDIVSTDILERLHSLLSFLATNMLRATRTIHRQGRPSCLRSIS